MSYSSRSTWVCDYKGLSGGKGGSLMPLTTTPTSLQLLLEYWSTLKHKLQFSLKCQCYLCGNDVALDHHLL